MSAPGQSPHERALQRCVYVLTDVVNSGHANVRERRVLEICKDALHLDKTPIPDETPTSHTYITH